MKWALLICLLWAGGASAACRQALAIGMDVSGSVDAGEYRLQLDGLADALDDPGVRDALFAIPDAPVSLLIFEWSGPLSQRVLVDWTLIDGPEVLTRVTQSVRAAERSLQDPSTAIGAAKRFGASALATQSACWRRVLDLSGDGKSNTGPRPGMVRPQGVTVNALVIGTDSAQGQDPGVAELTSYFRAYVIEGEGAFIETALGFKDLKDAMIRKLKRELQVLVVGQAKGQ